MLEPKTVMTILRRLAKKGIVTNVGKGVYYINDEIGYCEDRLIEYYAKYSCGVASGYNLLNQYKISKHKESKAIVYTNLIGMNKNVGNVQLLKINLGCIGFLQEKMIHLLLILEHDNIIDCDVDAYINVVQDLLSYYSDNTFKEIIAVIKVKLDTVKKLEKLLVAAKIKNNCAGIFLRK